MGLDSLPEIGHGIEPEDKMMADQPNSPEAAEPRSRGAKTRSPAYPSLDLKSALEKARLLYGKEKRNPMPMAVAAEHWGQTTLKSSGFTQGISALIKYGLLEDVAEEGKSRSLRITDSL